MTTDAHDRPDWQAMREREIALGIDHGLDPDSAAAAADDVIAYRQDVAGQDLTYRPEIEPARIMDNPDGFLIGVAEPVMGEPERFSADDTGRIAGWSTR